MSSSSYIDAVLALTEPRPYSYTAFYHDSPETAYTPTTILTDQERKALRAHVNGFFRRNFMNGVFRLKVLKVEGMPDSWYIEKVKL